MRNSRIILARFIAVASIPVAMALAAGSAGAQAYPNQRGYPNQRDRGANSQRQLFEWTGRVDREIRIQANRTSAQVMAYGSNERNNGGRLRSVGVMPRQEGTITVQLLQGRGQVDVVQQPSARNGYTAVIRVRDGDAGASRYRVAAYFTPSGYNNGGYNNGGYNNGGYGRRR